MGSGVKAHRSEVCEADVRAFEGVAQGGILFEDDAAGSCGAAGVEDGWPVEVSFTDLE